MPFTDFMLYVISRISVLFRLLKSPWFLFDPIVAVSMEMGETQTGTCFKIKFCHSVIRSKFKIEQNKHLFARLVTQSVSIDSIKRI